VVGFRFRLGGLEENKVWESLQTNRQQKTNKQTNKHMKAKFEKRKRKET